MATDPEIRPDENEPNRPADPQWTWIDSTRPIGDIVRRDPAGGILERTGRLELNAEGSDLWDAIATESGIAPAEANAFYGANADNRTVSAFPVPSGVKGATDVNRDDQHHAHRLHLARVFEKVTSLRPTGMQHVQVSRRTSPDGKPYLLIDLQTGQAQATTTREGSKEHERRVQTKTRRMRKRTGSTETA
jgi:hypothetical protein